MRIWPVRRTVAALLLLGLAACAASGPTLRESMARLAPLGPEQGRLYVYRDVVSGGIQSDMVRPDLLLDGQPAGSMQAGAVLVFALPAGRHVVAMAPPAGGYALSGYKIIGGDQTVELEAGGEKFIKIAVVQIRGYGTDFAVRQVPPAVARPLVLDRVLQERTAE